MAGPAVVVRRAHDGEPITTLDGQARTMDADVLAICDAERPAVIAGIMAPRTSRSPRPRPGWCSRRRPSTVPRVLHAALRLGLRSESSARFEKGLPVELPPVAMAIASRLLVELAEADVVAGVLDEQAPAPAITPVALRPRPLERGARPRHRPARVGGDLRRLGCEVDERPDAHEVIVPYTVVAM